MLFLSIFLIFDTPRYLEILICSVIAIIYGLFIIYDTQLIAGGKHSELTYDDYIIGALLLYVDIVGMFVYILRIFGRN
jgi:FtsH-binding integral membrane protein